MRLADFITANREPILLEWEAFAREIDSSHEMDVLALRDHAEEILLATIQDMRSAQSASERTARSRGHFGGNDGAALEGASEQHAIDRLGSGFNLLEVVSEYRALRASVLQQWHDHGFPSHDSDVDDVTRFNESIDQSLETAVRSYTKRVDQSRDLFLAILSHDLRNPLNSISMSASLLPHLGPLANEAIEVASQITTDAGVMARMISDLLDYTRTRLGAGMPVSPAPMDLRALCHELHREFVTAHPDRQIRLRADSEVRGSWDRDRLRQAISNLMGNAIQHSPDSAPVDLTLRGENANAIVTVHNGGPPILPGELARIFDPLVRGSSADHPRANRTGSIGLGLYIARAVIESHGGAITVVSSQQAGTTFTLSLPCASAEISSRVNATAKNLPSGRLQ
ncbi:sensor histidine kinase [Botrimarina sp.]|uniref:sensor histidine kinase n=1 Tax=Botrimarina sp. TaxID=2795802 RepID=UPI0032EC0B6E